MDSWFLKTLPPSLNGPDHESVNHNSFLFFRYSLKELLENLYIGHQCNDPQYDFYSIWISLNYLDLFIFVNRLLDGLVWRNLVELSCSMLDWKSTIYEMPEYAGMVLCKSLLWCLIVAKAANIIVVVADMKLIKHLLWGTHVQIPVTCLDWFYKVL